MDFGEFQVEHADGRVEELYMFAMILGYSRKIYAELIPRYDLPNFLDCHMRAFEHFGGLPVSTSSTTAWWDLPCTTGQTKGGSYLCGLGKG